ncbi:MAG: hemolysin III family protein [Candidatus Marinimicrobia bacterium]|jgi:hemolysin III|nr:hemolysin III family protein [Candidatus Neomarinimicrobiota bacterium]
MNKKKKKVSLPNQSMGEEIANSIIHGIGIALSIAALVLLVVFSSQRGDVWQIVSFSIYGATLVILYLFSTLYHGFHNKKVKEFFRLFDYASIYLLIAGTYTPVTLTILRGPLGWTVFGIIWGLAILGVVKQFVFFHKFQAFSVITYLIMGWLIVFVIKPLLAEVPIMFFMWMLIGGLSYTLGIIFFIWEKMPYNHSIWHLFVLGGSIGHFFAFLFYLI